MADSEKITKNYKLMGTESDPVIIAQRLLNLYRQLHIFSPEKKAAYNQMLIEQTPEVKRTLGLLPGGVVVQQYIADIEAKEGITSDDALVSQAPTPNTEEVHAAAPEVAAPYAEMPRAAVQPTVVSVANDPALIKGIVDALKEAMITSEKNRKEDTKELIQTLMDLQNKLVQSVLEKTNMPINVPQPVAPKYVPPFPSPFGFKCVFILSNILERLISALTPVCFLSLKILSSNSQNLTEAFVSFCSISIYSFIRFSIYASCQPGSIFLKSFQSDSLTSYIFYSFILNFILL